MRKFLVLISFMLSMNFGYAKSHHHSSQKDGVVKTTVKDTGKVVSATGKAAGDIVEGTGKAVGGVLESL